MNSTINLDTAAIWIDKDGYDTSHLHAMMPHVITSENMFDGWQYYQTTEMMLNKKVIEQSPGSSIVVYTNRAFVGKVWWSFNQFYGYVANLGTYNTGRVTRQFSKLPEYKNMLNSNYRNEIMTQHSFEKWMFKKIYNR